MGGFEGYFYEQHGKIMSNVQSALPLSSVIALIEQLSGGSRHRLPWSDVRKLLDDLTEGHFWLRYPMPSDWKIFRGRVSKSLKPFLMLKISLIERPKILTNMGGVTSLSVLFIMPLKILILFWLNLSRI